MLACKKEDFGKLFIRVILGVFLTAKGIVFFVNGKSALVALGKILSTIKISCWPLYFGCAIAIVYIVCGMTFLLGAFFKTSAFLLGSVILLNAVFKYFSGGALMDSVGISAMLAVVMYGFMFIGSGSCSVQK